VNRFSDEPADDWLPGPQVTPALYRKWRDARRGTIPAENLNNPVWEWLIRTRISAYQANHYFQGPDSHTAGPPWCFARYGQSRTLLPDGRMLLVAGEHEDSYDPDFFIYNDVVVWHPDDTIDVYGYPVSDFPPTDFHSATLAGDRLILVGSLGYVEDRIPGRTQVLSLDTGRMQIQWLETTGDNPGWIFKHSATLQDGWILIRAGEIQNERGILENIDDWQLELNSLRWTRLTDRKWPRFEFVRQDGEMNCLWQIRIAEDMRRIQSQSDFTAEVEESIRNTMELIQSAGLPPMADPGLLHRLYRPEVDHELVPRDENDFEEHSVHRIRIDDVVVRYVEDSHAVVLTVEGSLPPSLLNFLVADLRGTLSRLESAEFMVRRL
jgi:hypothetical protein